MDLAAYKEYFGLLSVALAALSYFPYYWTIIYGKTRPHLFSWLIWATVNAIAFAAQFLEGGGAGSWTTGFTALLCLGVVGLSFWRGEKNITRTDWIALASAGFAIVWWCVTKDALGAVILAIAIDIIGIYPTIRKTYIRPHEEAIIPWFVSSLRSGISIPALESYTLVTIIFPIAMIFTNGGIAVLVIWRRWQLAKINIPAT